MPENKKQWTINGVVFEYDIKKDNVRDSTDILYEIIGYRTVIVDEKEVQEPILKEVLKLEHFRFTYNQRGYIESASKTYDGDLGDWYGNISVYSKYQDKVDIGRGCYTFDGTNDPTIDLRELERIEIKEAEEEAKRQREASRVEAQSTYTAIMTDTLLPADENSNDNSNAITLSPMAEKIKTWYEMGLWTYAMVENAKNRGVITEDEFREITQSN